MAVDLAHFGFLLVFGVLLNVALIVGVVVLVVLGVRWLVRNTGAGRDPAQDAAVAALRERFARGEIDAEEFEQRRRVLGG
jgi:putative membrane protein